MEMRSQSYEQKKHNKVHGDLQTKLDYILSEQANSKPSNYRHQKTSKSKNIYKVDPNNLHPTVLRVQSVEKMQFQKMKSAIHQLQEFITPTVKQQNFIKQTQANQINSQKPQLNRIHIRKQQNQQQNREHCIVHQQKQIMEYYKFENSKLKYQLSKQREQNYRLSCKLSQVKNLCVKLQDKIKNLVDSKSDQVVQLQKDFKQQLVINLELEELLLKQHLKHLQANKHHQNNQNPTLPQSKISTLQLENSKLKEQNDSLKAIIEQNELQLNRLRQQIISEQSEVYQELQSPTFAHLKMAKQNIVISTNASLENTIIMQKIIDHEHHDQ